MNYYGDGDTLLSYAILAHVPGSQIVQKFLDKGARVDTIYRGGDTALHLAAKNGAFDVLRSISEACHASGCPMNPMNDYGRTPLDDSSDASRLEYESWALERGVICIL